ncbi:putative quinol monooxygenase [Pelagicoccus albus]|uniref:Antibiotic biosynthesis monooxygenase n=1 Tax=Pelagicoccus albus TaxID=415222 RepID=A0A7X1B440_9BACT|nr:putative quinol monooxygenase [Pelagicoccus albus]MBC2605303.1 antibiotic biosynthesis monooxygenase [Pelagicoccus albus]
MKPPLTIAAHVEAKSDKAGIVKSELRKLLPISKKEKGCLTFEINQDNDRPEHFFIYEIWENRAAWKSHLEAQHVSDYITAVEGCLADVSFREMSLVS